MAAESMDLPERISEEILACKVCFLRYDQHNLPKMLPCSHTFCFNCITDYLESKKAKNKSKFPCPLCRKETTLPGSDGVKNLPNNYTVLDLMDMVEEPQTSTSGVSHKETTVTAELTQIEKESKASVETSPDLDQSDTSALSQTAVAHKEKCCRCGRSKGVFEIKCEHKICKSCKKKEKKMDATMLPCQICLAMSSGVDYYTEEEPPPYCEHEGDRPPAYNPTMYGSGAVDTLGVPNTPANGYAQPGHTPVQPPVSYQQVNQPMANGYVTQSLSDDFVSRVSIDEQREVLNSTQQYQAPMAVNVAYQPPQQYQQPPQQYQQPPQQYQQPPQQHQQPPQQYQQPPHAAQYPQDQGHTPQGQYVPNVLAAETPMLQADAPVHVVGQTHQGYNQEAQPSRRAPAAPSPVQHQASSDARSTPSPTRDSQPSVPPQQAMPGAVPVFPGVVEQLRHTVKVPQAPSNAGVSVFVNPDARAPQPPPRPESREGSPAPVAPPAVKKRQVPAVPQKKQEAKRSSQPASNSPRNSQGPSPTNQFPSQGQVPLASTPSGPKVPPRRLLGEPQGLPFKCVKKFGRYSDSKMQSGAFQKPSRVSVAENGGIVVTDDQEMTVQIFTADGDYTYMFKVLGIQGACMWAQDKLAIATHRGVEIYNVTGYQEKELLIGSVINTVPYKYGFIAIKQKSLVFFDANLNQTKEITKKKAKTTFKKSVPFENIKDAAVSMSKDIVVLEGPVGDMTIIDDDGVVKSMIQPQNESCGKISDPFAVTFDRWANIFVSDIRSRKVLRFSPNGRFSRCVLNFTLGETSTPISDLKAYGVSASAAADHLITVICGASCAEVRIYKLY